MQPFLSSNPMLAFSSSSPLFGGIASLASSNPLFGGGGSHLEPYRQYLQSTYTAPVQNRVDSFLQNLQQQEQQFFGAPMGGMQSPMGGGGFMGSPAQPGEMQRAAFNAAQARNPAPSAPDPSDPRSMLGFGSPFFGMYSGPPVPALGGAQASAQQSQQVGQPAPNPSDAFGGQPNFGAMAGTLVNGGNDGFAQNRMAQIGQLPAATRNFGALGVPGGLR